MAVSKLKFAANLSTMFEDEPFYRRFDIAAQKGFKAVEAQFLYDYNPAELRNAKLKAGLDVVLINSPVGDIDTFGLASIPGQELSFITSIQQATVYAVATDCKRVHIMAGIRNPDHHEDDLYKIYVNNLKVGVEMLEEYNMTAVIEPICNDVKENYFLDSYEKARRVITDVGSERLKLLMDIYHMRMMGLDPELGIPLCLDMTDHIQISQAPLRQEPFSSGLINYTKVFDILERCEYKGHIGLEYKPSDPVEAFNWLGPYLN